MSLPATCVDDDDMFVCWSLILMMPSNIYMLFILQKGNMWMDTTQAIATGESTWDGGTYPLFDMGAACWYFAQKLADSGVSWPIGMRHLFIGYHFLRIDVNINKNSRTRPRSHQIYE